MNFSEERKYEMRQAGVAVFGGLVIKLKLALSFHQSLLRARREPRILSLHFVEVKKRSSWIPAPRESMMRYTPSSIGSVRR